MSDTVEKKGKDFRVAGKHHPTKLSCCETPLTAELNFSKQWSIG
jgi:hypothetical protein